MTNRERSVSPEKQLQRIKRKEARREAEREPPQPREQSVIRRWPDLGQRLAKQHSEKGMMEGSASGDIKKGCIAIRTWVENKRIAEGAKE